MTTDKGRVIVLYFGPNEEIKITSGFDDHHTARAHAGIARSLAAYAEKMMRPGSGHHVAASCTIHVPQDDLKGGK